MRLKLFATILVLSFLLTALPVFLFETEEVEAQEEGPMQLNTMKLHLMEGMEMTPVPPQSADEYSSILIPNGYRNTGFRGWGILPVGRQFWEPVGVWESDSLKKQINLGGQATVLVYGYNEEGKGNVNVDFRFEVLRGNEVLLTIEAMDQIIIEGQDTPVEAHGWFPAANDTAVEPGDKIGLRITARCTGGAIMKFGSSRLDSGITFGSNALSIQTVTMCREHVTLEYIDAFLVPWTKLYTEVRIDRIKIPNEEMSTDWNSMNMSREIHWERRNNPGQYEVFVSISYDLSGQNNISDTFQLKIPEREVSRLDAFKDFFIGNLFWIILVILMIIGLVYVVKARKRTWRRRFRELPPEIQSKSKHRKKKTWKKMYKAQKKRKKQEKLKEKERKEMEGSSDFRLFKKKSKRPVAAVEVEEPAQPEEELEL